MAERRVAAQPDWDALSGMLASLTPPPFSCGEAVGHGYPRRSIRTLCHEAEESLACEHMSNRDVKGHEITDHMSLGVLR